MVLTSASARGEAPLRADACRTELEKLRTFAGGAMQKSDLQTTVLVYRSGGDVNAEVIVALPGGEKSTRVFRARKCSVVTDAARVYLQLVSRSRRQEARALADPIAPAAAIEESTLHPPAPAVAAVQARPLPAGGTSNPWNLMVASGVALVIGPMPEPGLAGTAEIAVGRGRYRARLRASRSVEQQGSENGARSTFRSTSFAPAVEARALGPLHASIGLERSAITGRSENAAMPATRHGRALSAPLGVLLRWRIGRASLLLRSEVALPLAGDRFLVETPRGLKLVHDADRLGFRAGLLLGWSFFDPDRRAAGHLEAR